MCKSSELKKINEYFNVLIFGSLDLKNIDLEMAIRQEWKYVINLITFTGMGPSTYTKSSQTRDPKFMKFSNSRFGKLLISSKLVLLEFSNSWIWLAKFSEKRRFWFYLSKHLNSQIHGNYRSDAFDFGSTYSRSFEYRVRIYILIK